ncbi:MAG: ATP synthase F0 subunit C, partial [Magnetococcales bacterium]|nr:ATP synthase F0 subunit C [Magnetococcales bacterium]
MESLAASFIGMGLAAAGLAGSGIGLGYMFGKTIESVARQPGAESQMSKYVWIGA